MLLARHPDHDNLLRWHPEIQKKKGFFGYWGGSILPQDDPFRNPDENKGLPDPQDYVVESWDPKERAIVLAHLKAGKELIAWRGFSWCRFKCGGHGIGTRCMTDGTYVWPEGFPHYVEMHHVKPPAEFIAHVMSQR